MLASPVDSEKVNENWVGANGKLSMKTFCLDSSSRPTPIDLETVNENWATIVSKIFNEIDFEGDKWIRQRPQPLLTQK